MIVSGLDPVKNRISFTANHNDGTPIRKVSALIEVSGDIDNTKLAGGALFFGDEKTWRTALLVRADRSAVLLYQDADGDNYTACPFKKEGWGPGLHRFSFAHTGDQLNLEFDDQVRFSCDVPKLKATGKADPLLQHQTYAGFMAATAHGMKTEVKVGKIVFE